MKQDEQVARGKRAELILRDPLIEEAFEAIEAECLRQWKAAPARDTEGRENIWMMIKLKDKLRAHLESVMNTGKIATKQIAQVEKESKISRMFA